VPSALLLVVLTTTVADGFWLVILALPVELGVVSDDDEYGGIVEVEDG
jgi:hypothetical protein